MYAVLLSGSVIVLAYVAAAAVIIPAISMIGFGKVPKFLRRGPDPGKTRTRMEGTGLLLIGMFILDRRAGGRPRPAVRGSAGLDPAGLGVAGRPA